MPLPEERNTTYAPNSQIKSDDLNDIQDCTARHWHGEIDVEIHAMELKSTSGTGIPSDWGWYYDSPGINEFLLGLRLPAGTRIKEIHAYGDQAADHQIRLTAFAGRAGVSNGGPNMGTIIGTEDKSVTGTGPVQVTLDATAANIPYTTVLGQPISVRVKLVGVVESDCGIHYLRIKLDRPRDP